MRSSGHILLTRVAEPGDVSDTRVLEGLALRKRRCNASRVRVTTSHNYQKHSYTGCFTSWPSCNEYDRSRYNLARQSLKLSSHTGLRYSLRFRYTAPLDHD